jgi:hypothetical protein
VLLKMCDQRRRRRARIKGRRRSTHSVPVTRSASSTDVRPSATRR